MLGASAVVLVADRRRLLLGESVAISAVAFVVLGGVAVGGLPTPGAYAAFARGLVDGWADLLSSAPPADITEQLRALPFAVAWLAAAVGGEIARHSRRPGLPGHRADPRPRPEPAVHRRGALAGAAQGAGILAGTFALIVVGQRFDRRDRAPGRATSTTRRVATNRARLMLGAAVIVGTVLVAPVLGPRLPLAEANERFDLRQYQVPPFDPLAVPSPLVQLKASLKDDRRDDVVFEVAGETPIDRWPVAVMSDYDGVVWTVADPERDPDATEFVPVDTQLPELDDPLPEGATTVEHTVTIRDLGGSFLPAAGTARRLELPAGTRPPAEPADRHRRPPRRRHRRAHLRGRASAVVPESDEATLAAATITPVDRTEELELLPPPVRNLAADIVEGHDRGWDQMAAIRDEFVANGYYDVSPDTPPGHSYARIASMLEDPQRVVGFEEQYAAAAAVMAQVAELPVRVVVGYRIPATSWQDGRAEVTAADIAAWVELDAGELGWVPVDVTPDRSRTPDPETQGATTEEMAIPNPPPPPPPPPQVEPPRQEDEEVDDEVEPVLHRFEEQGRRRGPSSPADVVGLPLLLFALFVVVVVGVEGAAPAAAPQTGRRRPGASPARGPRPSTGAPRPGRPGPSTRPRRRRCGCTPPSRGWPTSSPTCGSSPVRSTGRRTPPGRRPTSTPTRRGGAATRSSPSCAGRARRRSAMKMQLDPRPLRRDQATAGARDKVDA